jgi:uncharacterized membrane protein
VLLIRYLITSLKVVPRGTEGAVSIEGTIAGLLASILLAFVGCFMGEVLYFLPSLLMNTFFLFNFFFFIGNQRNFIKKHRRTKHIGSIPKKKIRNPKHPYRNQPCKP